MCFYSWEMNLVAPITDGVDGTQSRECFFLDIL